MYVCKSLFKHGKSSVKLHMKGKHYVFNSRVQTETIVDIPDKSLHGKLIKNKCYNSPSKQTGYCPSEEATRMDSACT